MLAIAVLSACGQRTLAADLASGWQGIPEAEVRLIAGRTASGQEMIALDFVIAPKWKVYWRSPGDAGYPPVADWSGSRGVEPGAISWPLPHTFVFWGLRTYGYADRVILPVTLEQRDRTASASVRVALSYATCADICVPVETNLSLELPPGDLPRNRHGDAISAAISATPVRQPQALASASLSREGETGPPRLVLELSPPDPIGSPDVIIEGNRDIVFGVADCGTPAPRQIRCVVPVEGTSAAVAALPGSALTVTIHGEGPAIETSGTVRPAP